MAVRAGNLFALDGLGTSGTGIYDAVCKCIWGQEKNITGIWKSSGTLLSVECVVIQADCGLESALIHSACACIGPAASGVVIQCMYNKADKTAHGWGKMVFLRILSGASSASLDDTVCKMYRGNGYNNTGGVTNAEKTQKDSSGIF